MTFKVTLSDVNSRIVSANYQHLKEFKTTLCLLTFDNGFVFEGVAHTQGDYDETLGERTSFQKAFDLAVGHCAFLACEINYQLKMNQLKLNANG